MLLRQRDQAPPNGKSNSWLGILRCDEVTRTVVESVVAHVLR